MATIFEALKICEYLESILRDSFGPCGLDVMLNSSSGNILITNSSGVILSSLSIGHPLGRVIVDKMKSHNVVTGDGVTSFIIVLTQALREITRCLGLKESVGQQLELKPQSWQSLISISKAFSKIGNEVVPSNIKPVLLKVARHIDLNLQNKDEIKQKLIQLVRTTLNGKFSLGCQDLFTLLLIEFISNTCQFGIELYHGILHLLDDFPQICVEFHGIPVHNSCVIQGFAIPRQFATMNKEVMPKSGKEHFTFLVLQCSLDNLKLAADVTFNIKNETMLGKALSHKRVVAFSILKSLSEQEVQLIISSEGVSDMILQLCHQFEIAVIQMVTRETVNHICKYSKMQPICHYDLFELKNLSDIFLGKGTFCQEKTLGVQKFIHLGIKQNNDTKNVSHQILLCAPTQGLCQQYSIALQSALKNIKMAFSTDNRQQLSTLPGCGSAEFLLSFEFGNLAKSTKDINISLACSVLSNSLLQVPWTLHRNSHSCISRDRNFIEIQQEVEFSWKDHGTLLGVDGISGSLIDPHRKGIYEPLNGKMFWISHLLECLAMILRVEQIIGVKCVASVETTSCNSDDEY